MPKYPMSCTPISLNFLEILANYAGYFLQFPFLSIIFILLRLCFQIAGTCSNFQFSYLLLSLASRPLLLRKSGARFNKGE